MSKVEPGRETWKNLDEQLRTRTVTTSCQEQQQQQLLLQQQQQLQQQQRDMKELG